MTPVKRESINECFLTVSEFALIVVKLSKREKSDECMNDNVLTRVVIPHNRKILLRSLQLDIGRGIPWNESRICVQPLTCHSNTTSRPSRRHQDVRGLLYVCHKSIRIDLLVDE